MLFDPKWERRLFTLEGLIAWLEKQPKATRYDFFAMKGCLACRYLQSNGVAEPWVDGGDYQVIFGGLFPYFEIAETRPWTYGAALKRALAAPQR